MNTETEQTTTTTLSLSEKLKAGREQRDMTQIEVARYLCLNTSIIEEIEQNCDEKMIHDVFYRGYIRSYAKLVGMPEEELNHYLGVVQPVVITPIAQEQAHQRILPGIKKHQSHKGLWLLLLGLAVAGGVWWALSTKEHSANVDESHFVPSTIENDQAEQTTPTVSDDKQTVTEKSQPEAQPSLSETQDGDVSHLAQAAMASNDPAQPEPVPAEQKPATDSTLIPVESTTEIEGHHQDAPPPLVAVAPKTLSLSFSGDCWVKIIDDNTEEVLFTGIKKAGDVLEFDEKTKYKMTIGNVHTINVVFNQKSVDLTPYVRRNSSAQFTLDATNLSEE